MANAKLTKKQIQKLMSGKFATSGFDIYLSKVNADPIAMATMINEIGKWASDYEGLGFGGTPTVALASPRSANHPSPVHSDAFAITFKWNKKVKLNGPQTLHRLRYVFEGYDGYDGAELYQDTLFAEITK